MEIGVPLGIAEYLTKLNQSIVKLKSSDERDDLVDETNDRMVLLNPDGTLNPNLPDEVKMLFVNMDLAELKEDTLEETSSIGQLIGKGYSLVKRIGIAQGGAISCGISTLNLKELYARYPHLEMYADDGLYFPKKAGETPNLEVPLAGVSQALEKSG